MRYIDADKLKEAFHTDTEHLQSFDESLFHLLLMEIDEAPSEDVVPREEYEALRKKMLPSYVQAMTEENAMKIGYERGRTEVARIFVEIEEEIVAALESNYKWVREHNVIGNTVSTELMQRVYGKIDALRGIEGFVEELKEKYTKGGAKDE